MNAAVSSSVAMLEYKDLDRLIDVSKRAEWVYRMAGDELPLGQSMVDLIMCHARCHLKLAELLEIGDDPFAKEILDIRRHIDRDTGTLRDGYWPRYAEPECRS